MKKILRDIKITKHRKITILLIIVFFILIFQFTFFLAINNLKNFSQSKNNLIYNDTINDLKFVLYSYYNPINKRLAEIIKTLDNIYKISDNKNKILNTLLDNLNYLLAKENLVNNYHITKDYKNFLIFLKQMLQIEKKIGYKDIKNILTSGKKYLIILENIGESRPNGGFFGSYGLLSINRTGFRIKIFDSYYPIFVNTQYIKINKQYVKTLLNTNKINLLSSIIRGFTNKDGKNIKNLFEKTFSGIQINGIIFIKSSLFEKTSLELKKQIYKRQFINASIDLIRGNNKPFKKEKYLKEINNLIKHEYFQIIIHIIKNWEYITKKGYIQLYLPNISNNLRNFLEKYNLIFERKNNCFYFFDYNFGYNKIDRFLEKNIFIISGDKILAHIYNKNKICLPKYPKKIKIKIIYFLNIPEQYIDFIKRLEKQFQIKLTLREQNILGLIAKVKNKGIIIWPSTLGIKPTIYNYTISGNYNTSQIEIILKKNSLKIIK